MECVRGRTFFMLGRLTGFGTESFDTVAMILPLDCGRGRIDGVSDGAAPEAKPKRGEPFYLAERPRGWTDDGGG